jgi:hypothetical protein
LSNFQRNSRAIVEGDLTVHWETVAGLDKPAVKSIDASRIAVKERKGDPAFELLLSAEVPPFEGTQFIDPLILYDLDNDGLSEMVLSGRNLIFRRGPDGRFASEPLCRHAPGLIFTGTLADFDGDGNADFSVRNSRLLLFKGSRAGPSTIRGAGLAGGSQIEICASPDLRRHRWRRDLDVWLGQHKVPYERGQMPTPYFDANDGHPSYLLLNDGPGVFDGTEASGLAPKRWRRCSVRWPTSMRTAISIC